MTAIVCAIVAFFAFRELLYGEQSPVGFFGMSILFGGVAIHTIWRMIRMAGYHEFVDMLKKKG